MLTAIGPRERPEAAGAGPLAPGPRQGVRSTHAHPRRPLHVFGAAAETSGLTLGDGTFAVATTQGCRGVFLDLPSEPDPALGGSGIGAAWRRVEADSTTCPAAGSDPVGRTPYGFARHLRQRILDPTYLYIQRGDSIAAGVSVCFFVDSDYSNEVAAELDCLCPGSITRNNRGGGGWHSEDLLTPMDGGSANAQYIPNVVAANPDLVTISICGNDFLNTEPNAAGQNYPFNPADMQASLQELIHTRRTVQQILSVLISQAPNADVEINAVVSMAEAWHACARFGTRLTRTGRHRASR